MTQTVTCINSARSNIKPLTCPINKPSCWTIHNPTRWLFRLHAANVGVGQYVEDSRDYSYSACSIEISGHAARLLRMFQDHVSMMSLTMAQTIIESLESLTSGRTAIDSNDFAGFLEVAQERRSSVGRTCESKTNLTIFSPHLKPEKKNWSLIRCHLIDRKDHEHVTLFQWIRRLRGISAN